MLTGVRARAAQQEEGRRCRLACIRACLCCLSFCPLHRADGRAHRQTLSPLLAQFMGVAHARRSEVTAALWRHIRAHNLQASLARSALTHRRGAFLTAAREQDPKDKRKIKCDAVLEARAARAWRRFPSHLFCPSVWPSAASVQVQEDGHVQNGGAADAAPGHGGRAGAFQRQRRDPPPSAHPDAARLTSPPQRLRQRRRAVRPRRRAAAMPSRPSVARPRRASPLRTLRWRSLAPPGRPPRSSARRRPPPRRRRATRSSPKAPLPRTGSS